MTWNYRVLSFDENGFDWLAIYEVHYDAEGTPIGYGSGNTGVLADGDGDRIAELSEVLGMMSAALTKPILKAKDFISPEKQP